MVKTGLEHAWLPQSLNPRCSLIHTVNFSGNQIFPLAGFSTTVPLRLEEVDELRKVNPNLKLVLSSNDKNQLREVLS